MGKEYAFPDGTHICNHSEEWGDPDNWQTYANGNTKVRGDIGVPRRQTKPEALIQALESGMTLRSYCQQFLEIARTSVKGNFDMDVALCVDRAVAELIASCRDHLVHPFSRRSVTVDDVDRFIAETNPYDRKYRVHYEGSETDLRLEMLRSIQKVVDEKIANLEDSHVDRDRA